MLFCAYFIFLLNVCFTVIGQKDSGHSEYRPPTGIGKDHRGRGGRPPAKRAWGQGEKGLSETIPLNFDSLCGYTESARRASVKPDIGQPDRGVGPIPWDFSKRPKMLTEDFIGRCCD